MSHILSKPLSDIFIPDGTDISTALARVTHMGIAAHQDDLEIMAYDGILQCFGRNDAWFAGVVVSNGAGSPRDGIYAEYTDDDMQAVRFQEQRKAAYVGEYAACVQMAHSSASIKNAACGDTVSDIAKILTLASPEVVYTHNLADKHDTHVAVALRVIDAIRALPRDKRPKHLYGCEVWRGLDWLSDDAKTVFNVSAHPNLAASLVGVFDSQIAGGKRYDNAAIGRRRANATFFASHNVDKIDTAIYGIDMTAFINDDSLDPCGFIEEHIYDFKKEVTERISKFK